MKLHIHAVCMLTCINNYLRKCTVCNLNLCLALFFCNVYIMKICSLCWNWCLHNTPFSLIFHSISSIWSLSFSSHKNLVCIVHIKYDLDQTFSYCYLPVALKSTVLLRRFCTITTFLFERRIHYWAQKWPTLNKSAHTANSSANII